MVPKIVSATVERRQRQSYPHWRHDVIRFTDLDPIGHVNNLVYIAFFPSDRVIFSCDLAQAVDDPAPTNSRTMAIDLGISKIYGHL